MRKLLPILNIMGLLLMVFSLTFLMPIVTSLIYRDGTLAIFVREMIVTFIIGFTFSMAFLSTATGSSLVLDLIASSEP